MRVSLTLDFRNPPRWHRPWKELWEDNLFLMTQGEQMGFDALLVQEHFFMDDGYGPSVPVFLAVLAERTRTARIGSFIQILPLHNPAKLAQEIAVLDHLCGGRLDVGLAIGHRAAEFRAFQMSQKTRPSRFEEGFAVLKKAWAGEPFDHAGRWYTFNRLTVAPKPLQRPHPPLWIGATTPVAARRAGRLGTHLYAGSTDPATIQAYREGLAEGGHDPARCRIAVSLSITATRGDPEAAWRRIREQAHYRWDFYRVIRQEMGDAMLSVGVAEAAPDADAYRGNELVGSPAQIIETIGRLRDQLGMTDLVMFGAHAGTDLRGAGLESQALFAQEVLPELRRW
ncbi:MAG: LLM class flavin-dependent oxidoreductase [Gammaproteobacteria bacterium]